MDQNKQIITKQFWSNYARLYDKFYPTFQNKMLAHIVQYAHGKVGDFGTGTGKLYKHLDKNDNIESIIGFDSNSQMLNLATQKLNQYFQGKQKETRKLEINLIDNQTPKETFDTIYLVNVLYANENPINILKQIYKKLKPNGTQVIIDMKREVNLKKLFSQLKKEYPNDKRDLKTYYTNNEFLAKNAIPHSYTIDELETITNLIGNYKILEKREDFLLNNVNCLVLKKN